MDFMSVDLRIPDRVCHLARLHRPDRLGHRFQIFLGGIAFHIAHHRGDALRHGFRRNDDDPAVLGQFLSLIGRKNDILVVRKDIDGLRVNLADRLQHIIRARIHRLSALDEAVDAESAEDLAHAVPDCDGNETGLLSGPVLRLWLILCKGGLHFRLLEELLLMLDPHVVNFHPAEAAVFQSLLKGKSRMIRVHMNFHDVIIRDQHQTVSDGGEEGFQLLFLHFGERFFEIDDEFGAVSELDVIRADFFMSLRCGLRHLCAGRSFEGQIQFLPVERVHTALEHGHQSLSAGIHDAGFLQNREHVRRPLQRLLSFLKNQGEETGKILRAVLDFIRLQRHRLRNGEDRALLRLHHGLIGRLHGLSHRLGDQRLVKRLMVPYRLRESPEQLGKNHARVAPCASE